MDIEVGNYNEKEVEQTTKRIKEKFKEKEEKFEEFEEDFEIIKPDFEVWAFGYDADDQITDFEVLLCSSENPDQSVAWAKQIVEDRKFLDDLLMINKTKIPENVAYLSIEVEETVNVDGVATNAGSIYYENILIKKN